MYGDFNNMLKAFVFNPDRALQEVNNNYSVRTIGDMRGLSRLTEHRYRTGGA